MEQQPVTNRLQGDLWQVPLCWGTGAAFVSLILSHSPKNNWVGFDSSFLIDNPYSTLYIFAYVTLILPVIQEWVLRAVFADVSEILDMPFWVAAGSSAYLSMSYMPLQLLDPLAHFVLSIYFFHTYIKYRSLKRSVINAGFVHLCIFVVMYLTNQLPNQ